MAAGGNPRRLTEAPVGPALLSLAVPMTFGIGAVVSFSVAATFFVGQLGPDPLAAMSFTFPVVFFVMSIAIGIGIGTTSVISRAMGAGDTTGARRTTTDALALAVVVAAVVVTVGLATTEPLFRSLGAPDHLLPLIQAYMRPWYAGAGFLMVMMVGNAAIRATGDTKTPSAIMALAGIVNVCLDPLLIFGIGPFPRMELQGAALSTLVAWAVAFVAAVWILVRRDKLVDLRRPSVRVVLASWKSLLYVGVPAAATNVMVPLAGGILTRILASHGPKAVGGFGVALRLESLSMIGILGFTTGATVFVGQNFGAAKYDRLRVAFRWGTGACIAWSLATSLVLVAFARPIARAFSDDPAVIEVTATYVTIVPVSLGMLGVSMFANSMFNGANRPGLSALVMLLRLFAFVVPFAIAGEHLDGPTGMFAGIALANAASGAGAIFLVRRFLRELDMSASA